MSKKILVVVDMQRDFITGPLGNEECVNVVDGVVDLIENGNYDEIYVTYDTHNKDYLETNEGKNLPVPHCIKGTDGYELNDRVKEAIVDASGRQIAIHEFEKSTFGSMNLAQHLMNEQLSQVKNDTQIDFCGVCTGICVISNVLLAKAAVPDVNIRVIANACACATPESHKTALEAMRMCQIEVIE